MNYDIEIDIQAPPGNVSPEAIERLVRAVCETTLRKEGAPSLAVSVVVTDDERIRDLNRRYRGVDSATDVLAFPLLDAEELVDRGHDGPPRLLGDVVISVERAASQAAEFGHAFRREFAYLLVHGLLHLLGYTHDADDDQRRMRASEEAALAALGLSEE